MLSGERQSSVAGSARVSLRIRAAAQTATSSSVMGMANQSVCASKAAGRSRISRPLTTSPCATETTKAVPGFRTENGICS